MKDNISFDKLQHRVVQSCRVSTLDVHISPPHIKEQMIIYDVYNHPPTLVDATRAYSEATSSSVRFLIAKNEQMDKELQTVKYGGE